jgi:hypothetical protein
MPRKPQDPRVALLNGVLAALRGHGHIVEAVVVQHSGDIEVRLSAQSPGQAIDALEQWRAGKGRPRTTA